MLLVGCVDQSVDVKNNSSGKDIDQSINIGGGVPLDLYEAKVEEAEKAKNKLEELEKDRSLDETARGILAVAEKAREEGDEEKYLAKIREYRKFLNKEPIKRAAESWELEGQVLFSQLRVEEAQKAIEEAIKLDSNNPEYLLTLADYLRWNGKYQRMEKVSIQVIALIENEENVDEKLLGGAYSYLGLAYLNGGKYDLANNYLQQALEMRKKGLGEKHPYVATSLNGHFAG